MVRDVFGARMAGDRARGSGLTLARWAEERARRARREDRREALRLWCEDMAGVAPLVVVVLVALSWLVEG